MRDQPRSVSRPAGLLRRRQPSLRTLIVAVIIVLILPFIGSALFVTVRLSAAEHQKDEAQNLGIARAFSSEVDRQLLNAEAALKALATSPQLQNGDFAAFYLQSVSVANQHGARIVLVDANGRPIFNTVHPFGTQLPEFVKESRARVAAATQKPQISDLMIGSTTNDPLVAVYVPVIEDGSTRHALVMAFQPERLSHFFAEQQVPENWTIGIVDSNGRLIGRNRALDQFLGKAVTADLKAAIDAARERFAILHTTDGVEVYTAFTHSALSEWAVAFGIPRTLVEAPLRRSLVEIGIAGIAIILLCGSVALLTARRISRSMTTLSAAALALGTGEQPPQLAASIREVDEVVQSLRTAAATLASRSAERDDAEAALRESEQRFRDIAEVGGDWIWESDAEHRFTLFTGGGLEHLVPFGFSASDLLGKTRWQLVGVDPETDPVWRQHKADLDAHRPFRNFQYSATLPSQTRVHFAVSGKPVFYDNGVFCGYRGTDTDVTETVNALRRAECAEALLRDAVDSISEGFVIYDRDDRFVMCNDAYRSLFPHSAALMVPGTRYEDIVRANTAAGTLIVPPEAKEEWIAKHLADHQAVGGAVELQLNNGQWLLVTDRRMRNGGIAGLRIDISKLKATEAQLRQSRDTLGRAQRLAKMGSFEHDLRTGGVVCSEELYRIFGWDHCATPPPLEEFLALIHPEDRAVYEDSVRASKAGLPAPPIAYRLRCQDGSVKWMYTELDVVLDENDDAIRRIGIIRDITELREVQAREKELEGQLLHSQKLEALGTLAGGVAHELNNTLVPILALSKLALDELPETSSAREDIEVIIRASEHARTIVKQILAFSRQQDHEKQAIDLAVVTREALRMLRASLPSTIEIDERIAAVPPLFGDAGELHQVVVNLVTNAAQAIGGAVGRITIRVWSDSEAVASSQTLPGGLTVCLSVADTGCGMDEATVQRIFEPFFTTKGVGDGTGLGLAVVHGIVAHHAGTIGVQSQPGAGTEFILTFPAIDRFQKIGQIENAAA